MLLSHMKTAHVRLIEEGFVRITIECSHKLEEQQNKVYNNTIVTAIMFQSQSVSLLIVCMAIVLKSTYHIYTYATHAAILQVNL